MRDYSCRQAGWLVAALLTLSLPGACAQESFLSVKKHEPVWQVSRLGGYYDATGGIAGTVAESDLHLYGGRFADGRPVNGEPKLRNGQGELLTTRQYHDYRLALLDALERYERLESRYLSRGAPAWQLDNVARLKSDTRLELSSLEGSYRSGLLADRYELPREATRAPYRFPWQQVDGASSREALIREGLRLISRYLR